MQLAVRQEDANILLSEKNILNENVLDKYQVAGQIAQTGLRYVVSLINDSYHLKKTPSPYLAQELCLLGDSLLARMLLKVYTDKEAVREKGIAAPVSVEPNDLVGGFSPELDDTKNYVFGAGDVVTISLAVHIDGYTASVAHTMVIYPPGVEMEGVLKPEAPLVGSKADAVVATHVATETVVALLGLSLTPERIALLPGLEGVQNVTGTTIRAVVNAIAAGFNCVVVPGSRVRRVRRFLAGQAEGIVAERDFKGVAWGESDQEEQLLAQGTSKEVLLRDPSKPASSKTLSDVPTDDFVVSAGEVYNVDLKMAPLGDFSAPGLVTLEEIDHFSGKNNRDEFNARPTVFIRDVAVSHALKLKSSRALAGVVDRKFSVYPFKMTHTTDGFPVHISENIAVQVEAIRGELKKNKLGLLEMANRHMVRARPVQAARFLPLEKILLAANPTGKHGIDANKPTLPGMEVPLPRLQMLALKLKALLRLAQPIPVVRTNTTVVLDNTAHHEVIRLTGGVSPSWVHSQYTFAGPFAGLVTQLSQMVGDGRFGIAIREVQPVAETVEMQLDE